MNNRFQTEIDALCRAGLATHMIENEDAVDRVFALAKVRDLPSVHFASVFPDGTILLGCNDALPDPLAGLAREISAGPPPAPDHAAIDALHEKIDALAAGLSTPKDDPISGVQAQIAELAASNASWGDRLARFEATQTQSAVQARDTLLGELQKLQNGFAAQTTAAQLHNADLSQSLKSWRQDVLDAMQTAQPHAEDLGQLSELTAAIATQQTHMQQSVSNLAKDIAAFCASAGAAEAETDQDLAAAFLERMDSLQAVQISVQNTISALLERPDPSPPQALAHLETLPEVKAQIAALHNRLDGVTDPVPPVLDLTEQRQVMVRFETAMANVLRRLETATDAISDHGSSDTAAPVTLDDLQGVQDSLGALTGLPEKLDQIETALEVEATTITDIATRLRGIDARPVPVLDLTEQRKSFAQFATALGQIIKRFEGVADHLIDTTGVLGNLQTAAEQPAGTQDETDPRHDSGQNVIFDPDAISMDDLRLNFAELIANQFMQNIMPDTKTRPDES